MVSVLEPVGDRMAALLSGEIDHHTAAGMRQTIDIAVEMYRPKTLVLDFGGVSFMDSSGIGLVMGRYRLVSEYGGRLEVASIPRQLRQVMRIAGLDKLATLTNGGQEDETV